MKYNKLDLEQIEAIVDKLGGMEGVQRFLSGESVVSVAQKVWKTWKKIELGTGPKDADDFHKALKKADCICNIGEGDDDMLDMYGFMVNPKKTEVELVVVSVGEGLGFKEKATRSDIYKRANELGLDLCPNEVGPQLRLQYEDQPEDEWLLIAMEPITDWDGYLRIFSVGRNGSGKRWLRGDDGRPDNVWSVDMRWVFLRSQVNPQVSKSSVFQTLCPLSSKLVV